MISALLTTFSALRVYFLAASRPKIGTAGFKPAFSCSQGRRIARLSYVPDLK